MRTRSACMASLMLAFIAFNLACGVVKPSKPCTLSEPPEMRGLKLGMSQQDLKAKYDVLSSSGTISTFSSDFAGLSDIWFDTRFNQLSEVSFRYQKTSDTSEEFKRQFYQKIQESLKLDGTWEQPDSSKEKKLMRCGRYLVEAGLETDVDSFKSPGASGWFNYVPYVKLEDVEIKAQAIRNFEKWEAEQLKKKREEFKP